MADPCEEGDCDTPSPGEALLLLLFCFFPAPLFQTSLSLMWKGKSLYFLGLFYLFQQLHSDF